MPTRAGGAEAARVKAGDKQLDKDRAAYKALRHQGYQPRTVDGAAELAARAEDRFDVERGHLIRDGATKADMIEGEKIAREIGLEAMT